MTHWAAKYIGKTHAKGAEGPDSFSCWGLLRAIFRERDGVELPLIKIEDDEEAHSAVNVTAIKSAARLSGMRPVRAASQPLDGDVVLMTSVATLHCGLAVRANGIVGILHSASKIGVVFQPWREATAGMNVELWRREA